MAEARNAASGPSVLVVVVVAAAAAAVVVVVNVVSVINIAVVDFC